jgi:hypothetical protein
MPADREGGRLALPGAEMVIKVSPVDGEARLYPIGSPFRKVDGWQRGIKYFQHSYSSYLGWAALGEGGPELPAGRTGISFDRSSWSYRTNPTSIRVDPHHSISRYEIELSNPDPDMAEFGQVITHTLIGTEGEIHVFWHNSARPAFMMLAGYGIGTSRITDFGDYRSDSSIRVSGTRTHSLLKVLSATPGELGWDSLRPRQGWSHAHLFGGVSAYPHWKSYEPIHPNTPVVIYVNATRDRRPRVPGIEMRSEPGLLHIRLEGLKYQIQLPH